MLKLSKSKTGFILAGIYLLVSLFFILPSFSCSKNVCDAIGQPAAIFANMIMNILTGFANFTDSMPASVFLIILSIIGNLFFYYWIGMLLGKFFVKIFTKNSGQNNTPISTGQIPPNLPAQN